MSELPEESRVTYSAQSTEPVLSNRPVHEKIDNRIDSQCDAEIDDIDR